MSARSKKILALQFKYFGDAVLLTPALRALRNRFPDTELHLLVPEEIAPLFQHLPWVDRLWPMLRRRGSMNLRGTWPVIHALRGEHFDRSVDFVGNDRGAILSFLIGARQRLGLLSPGGFLCRRFCYTQRVAPPPRNCHETLRTLHVLSAWGIDTVPRLDAEIHADPALDNEAGNFLSGEKIVCHLSSSQPKKEWPLSHWAALNQLAAAGGLGLVFSTGVGSREESLLNDFKRLAPDAPVLQPIPNLALYLAVLKRAVAFVSGDTGPLHFAAGLGVPTVALFGPTSPAQWAPLGQRHRVLIGSECFCDGNESICRSAHHCLAAISPEQVFGCLKGVLAEAKRL